MDQKLELASPSLIKHGSLDSNMENDNCLKHDMGLCPCAKYEPTNDGCKIDDSFTTAVFLTRLKSKSSEDQDFKQNSSVIKKSTFKHLLNNHPYGFDFAQRELAIHRQISHPFVIKVFDVCESSTEFSVFMEFAGHGCNYLADKVKSCRIMSAKKLKTYGQQLLSALDYLHSEANVVHQDLKPCNCLIDHDNNIKLIDFGLSAFLDQNTKTSLMTHKVGTTGYMAPEAQSGATVSAALDMWAFGVMWHELATGQKPLLLSSDGSEKELSELPSWSFVDPQLVDLIKKCLVINPAARISAKEGLVHPYFAGPSAP